MDGIEVDPASPCTGRCALDRDTRICTGCRRTIDEISEWPAATPARKRLVLARLALDCENDGRRRGLND